jgi:hypothetical protein
MRTETKEYRSPQKKLLKFFERSRDQWKQKCLDAKLRVKRLHTKVANLNASREKWKKEAKEALQQVARLEAQVEELKRAISQP